jgi:hypothetical protein
MQHTTGAAFVSAKKAAEMSSIALERIIGFGERGKSGQQR